MAVSTASAPCRARACDRHVLPRHDDAKKRGRYVAEAARDRLLQGPLKPSLRSFRFGTERPS